MMDGPSSAESAIGKYYYVIMYWYAWILGNSAMLAVWSHPYPSLAPNHLYRGQY